MQETPHALAKRVVLIIARMANLFVKMEQLASLKKSVKPLKENN